MEAAGKRGCCLGRVGDGQQEVRLSGRCVLWGGDWTSVSPNPGPSICDHCAWGWGSLSPPWRQGVQSQPRRIQAGNTPLRPREV